MKRMSKTLALMTTVGLAGAGLFACEDAAAPRVEQQPIGLTPVEDLALAPDEEVDTVEEPAVGEVAGERTQPVVPQIDEQEARNQQMRRRLADVQERWTKLDDGKVEKAAPHDADRLEQMITTSQKDLDSLMKADATVWVTLERNLEAKLDTIEERMKKIESKAMAAGDDDTMKTKTKLELEREMREAKGS